MGNDVREMRKFGQYTGKKRCKYCGVVLAVKTVDSGENEVLVESEEKERIIKLFVDRYAPLILHDDQFIYSMVNFQSIIVCIAFEH